MKELVRGKDFIGIGCGAMIFNGEGLVFLAKRSKGARNEHGKWDFPGGSVEFGEKFTEAVKREIKEEFDFEIEVLELLEIIEHILPQEHQHWVSQSFLAKHVSGFAKNMEPDKNDELKWTKLEEIDIDLLTVPSQSNYKKYIVKYGFNPPKAL